MFLSINIALLVASGLVIIIAFFLLVYSRSKIGKANQLLKRAQDKLEDLRRLMENERKEAFLKLKDELYKKRTDFDLEIKRERVELDRLQSKINTKYEHLENKEHHLDELKRELQQRERNLSRMEDNLRMNENKIKNLYNDLIAKLERLGSLTKDDARQMLLDTLESEVRHANQKWIQKVEEEAQQTAKEKAVHTIVAAMQRYTADQVAPHSSGVINLPNDDMKGRIIGKEGRNIKALEMATGMEFVIGDTPEVITISGFNPVRREIARRALERLIADGRINPTRIEETVTQCEKELEELAHDYGRDAVLEFNIQNVHPDLIQLLGKLYFRTSFSQNVLLHSKEVALFSRMIAEELGLDGTVALRAGLLHDIGKAVAAEIEGPHAIVGSDIAKRCGENATIVNAIAAHHEEIPFNSVYGPIILIADTLSASRPGARRETLAAYLKRLEKLEDLAYSFDGIKKAYALQAGREIRIIVEEDSLTDDQALVLARNVANKIEQEMSFPGQIKVNVIREKRAIEYAR